MLCGTFGLVGFQHPRKQGVKDKPSSLFAMNQPCLGEYVHVVIHVNRRGLEHRRNLADILGTIAQKVDDAQPFGSRQRG